MMDGGSGSLGRHGLGSSSSCLDGVPFKIGPKFRPPPMVIYQPVIESSCSSKNSRNEYTFETEEAVLAWARAREEALIKASIEQEEAVKAAQKNNEKENKQDPEDISSKSENSDCNSATYNAQKIVSEETTGIGPNMPKPLVPPKPLIPKTISEPGAILKPTPIQHLHKAGDQNGSVSASNSASNSALDVSMFERVDDPFEALELQTIDDMEELKVLLDSTSSKDNKIQSSKEEKVGSNAWENMNSSEGIYELAAPVSTSGWEKFDTLDSFPNAQEQKNLSSVLQESTGNSESPASDDIGEYVDIVEESSIKFRGVNGLTQNPFIETTKSDNPNSNTDALGLLPKLNSASGIYRPVLPPIPNSMKVSNGEVNMHSLEQNNSAPCSDSVSGSANTPSVAFSNDTPVSMNSKVNYPKPVRIAPPPPVKSNRQAPLPKPRSSGQMWSSVGPSLADSLESNTKSAEEKIVNPYSRHSMDLSDTDLKGIANLNFSDLTDTPTQSSASQLNRYRPLPPAPSPRPFVEKGNQPLGLTDPYNSLSPEAKEFTDRITSMGFLRAKVARAVEKFDQDEKEVLDHLFAVDVLVEKKFAPVNAEAALQSCKNDLEKAERLLELQAQLEQLGFSSEHVRDALVKSDMDHDKALDLLTA